MSHISLFREFKENGTDDKPTSQLIRAFQHLSHDEWKTPTVHKDPGNYINSHLPAVLKEYEKSDPVIETILPNFLKYRLDMDEDVAEELAYEYKKGKTLKKLYPDDEYIEGDWEYELESTYSDHLSDFSYTVSQSYEKNKLIEVWRAIGIGHGKHEKDIFTDITTNYKGTGIYWTWNKSYAQAYWSRGGDEYVLHGFVRSQDIDWHNTILMNISLHFQEEREIRTEKMTQVSLVGIYDPDGKYHKFEEPLIIPTSKI
jgi:hypothetical protein